MKKFKSTGVFAALVIAFLAYVYLVEYKGKQEKEARESEQAKILNGSIADVKSFTITTGQRKITIERTASGDWNMLSPVQDSADKQAAEGLLTSLFEEKSEAIVSEGPQIKWDIFGLDTPKSTFELVLTGDKTQKVVLGSQEGVGGKRYLRLNDAEKVNLVSANIESQLNKEPKEFRNKEIFRVTKDLVQELKISSKSGKTLDLAKKDGVWTVMGNYSNETDKEQAQAFVSDIASMTAQDFLSEDKTKEKSSLGESAAQGELKLVDGKLIGFNLFKSKDNKFKITRNDRETIFEVNQRNYDLLNKSIDDLRDKKKPFEFEDSIVSQIDYKSDVVNLNLKKEGDKWTAPKDSVDSEKVQDLISKLKNLRVQKFYGKSNAKMYNPKGTITLKDQAGQILFDFKWGNEDSKNNVTVVKTNKHDELFGVPMDVVAGLPGQTLIQSESKAQDDHSQSNQPHKN